MGDIKLVPVQVYTGCAHKPNKNGHEQGLTIKNVNLSALLHSTSTYSVNTSLNVGIN